MTIVRTRDGRYFDLDDAALEGKEIQPEGLPEGGLQTQQRQNQQRPGGGSPQQGAPGGGQPIHVTINIGGGGSQGGPSVSMSQGGQPSEMGGGAQRPQKSGGEGGEADVEPRYYYYGYYYPTYYYPTYYYYW